MKKTICILLSVIVCFSLIGCNATQEPDLTSENQSITKEVEIIDVDLTKLSSTMVYAEVYNMISFPENYLGKTVRMRGEFAYAVGENRFYFACIISDATACCAQGIEFILSDERLFPDEYPAIGSEITVVGIFDTYNEDSYQYCQLIDAVLE